MRVPLKKLCEQLGVARALSAYETQPWAHHDDAKATTCSAEVRMGPGAEDLEAEIQLLRDEAVEDEEEGEGGGAASGGGPPPGVPEQVYLLRALPVEGEWEVKALTIKGKDYVNEFAEWDEKGCTVFRTIVQALAREEMPDIDAIIEEEMEEDDMWGSGRRGRVGRKSPKANAANLLGMKKGM